MPLFYKTIISYIHLLFNINTTNQASGKYNIFFIIDDNDFVYSTVDGQAELLLKITDPNGNEVEDITGLKKVENGFDITTRTGGFCS